MRIDKKYGPNVKCTGAELADSEIEQVYVKLAVGGDNRDQIWLHSLRLRLAPG